MVQVRRARISDVPALARLAQQSFYEAYKGILPADALAAHIATYFTPKALTADLANPEAIFFIAQVESKVIGYAKVCRSPLPASPKAPPALELVWLYTLQAWYGRGVGAALMTAVLEEAEIQQATAVWLKVWEYNKRAQAFYAKWGFQYHGTIPFALGDEVVTDHVLIRACNGV